MTVLSVLNNPFSNILSVSSFLNVREKQKVEGFVLVLELGLFCTLLSKVS